jgi:hypothetical protein
LIFYDPHTLKTTGRSLQSFIDEFKASTPYIVVYTQERDYSDTADPVLRQLRRAVRHEERQTPRPGLVALIIDAEDCLRITIAAWVGFSNLFDIRQRRLRLWSTRRKRWLPLHDISVQYSRMAFPTGLTQASKCLR